MDRGFTALAVRVLFGVALLRPSIAVAQQPTVVFDGVTVIDVENGTHIPRQRVVIVGTRIKAMGAAGKISVPPGARVVDARGKYMIPGLWDMHTHSRRYTDFFYPMFIASGITGIRDAGSQVPIDTLILWRREILAGTRVGPPRQILSGQSIAGPKAGCQRIELNRLPETCVADSADGLHFVDSLKAAGADMIKLRAVSKKMYFILAAESRRLGIPFGGHIDARETPLEVSDSGASIVDHMIFESKDRGLYGLCWAPQSASIAQCQPTADRFKHNGTWFVPTLIRYYAIDFNDWLGPLCQGIFVSLLANAKEFWTGSLLHGNWLRDSARTVTGTGGLLADSLSKMRIMMRTGLPILAGTDVGPPVMRQILPGFSLPTELATYVILGMTPLEVLRTATLNPAKLLHATDSLGTVTQGKLADLVLLDADPLADITNLTMVRAVVANGRYFDRAALDQLLTEVQAKARREPQPLGESR
jgi:hypothetical protein